MLKYHNPNRNQQRRSKIITGQPVEINYQATFVIKTDHLDDAIVFDYIDKKMSAERLYNGLSRIHQDRLIDYLNAANGHEVAF